MNFRHAVALALGWYLMAPPANQTFTEFDQRAPLPDWSILRSFDTAVECQSYLDKFQQSLKIKTSEKLKPGSLVMLESECVASERSAPQGKLEHETLSFRCARLGRLVSDAAAVTRRFRPGVSEVVDSFRIYVGGSIPTLRFLELQLADDAPLSRWRQTGDLRS